MKKLKMNEFIFIIIINKRSDNKVFYNITKKFKQSKLKKRSKVKN